MSVAVSHWAQIESSHRPASLDQLLAEAVERSRSDELLDFFEDGTSLTVGDFAALVDRLSCALSRHGVGKGSHVGLLLPNGPLYPAAFFSLARLGAVFVPVNAGLTAPEIDHVCSEADVSHLLVHADLIESLHGGSAEARLGPERTLITGLPGTRAVVDRGHDLDSELEQTRRGERYPRPKPSPDDLVSILFTSGSTGLPKGCMHSQEYWLVLGQTFAPLSASRRGLLDTPFSYMSGPSTLVRALFVGSTVVVARAPTLKGFISRVREQRIDFCWFPEVLLKQPARGDERDHLLRRAFVESLPDWGYEALERRFGVTARPCFAMTEIGMGTIVPWDDTTHLVQGAIGIPGPFRECIVVDDDHHPVGDGVNGELCVRGPGLFRGYYRGDEANAEAFLDDGWFRTGDLVRREADGFFHYVGRVKAVIRRSSEQISAQEVENALLESPAIARAAAIAVPDEFRGEEVKVYVLLADGLTAEDVPPQDIFDWLRERLAAFKVPRYIEYRDELPLTSSDKVDKPVLLQERADLRQDAYDRVDRVWR